jgi:hypothetical protein
LIVASDGIHSAIREGRRALFGTSADTGSNYYLWLGTDKLFSEFRYVFERTSAGWIWMHAYYLDDKHSTCVVECPPQTWFGLGLDRLCPDDCLDALEVIFQSHLEGHRLISQLDGITTFQPGRGRQLHNARWYADNIALVGDAAHTTHFSIGAGTRLAIGDAQALANAIHAHGEDVGAALRAYDATRRPQIDHLQQQALSSMRFLETVPELLEDPDMDPVQIAYALSRRLGTRGERWRYYVHLATQRPALRAARSHVTAARRARRARHRAHQFAAWTASASADLQLAPLDPRHDPLAAAGAGAHQPG